MGGYRFATKLAGGWRSRSQVIASRWRRRSHALTRRSVAVHTMALIMMGVILLLANGANGVAGAASTTKPKVVITSSSVALAGKSLVAPVTLSCSGAPCAGSIQLSGTVKSKKKVGKRTVTKALSVVLAITPYKLAKGKSATFHLTLTKTGRRSLAQANATSQLRAKLVASVKGGVSAQKALVVGANQFVGTYALTLTPNFCGPAGNGSGQVLYVDGNTITVPQGGPGGPFTGAASAQGAGYHLVLVQPPNEIEDDITITLSNGGHDIMGTGQVNLEAGNNVPCPISFTGVRTSTSVPSSAPTTTTTVPPATTTTAVPPPPPATTTTTAPASATSVAPCNAQAITAAVQSATQAPTSLSSFACSGSFAYADVVISPSPGQSDGAVEILMAEGGAWQSVGDPAAYCASMPAVIYQAAQGAGYCM